MSRAGRLRRAQGYHIKHKQGRITDDEYEMHLDRIFSVEAPEETADEEREEFEEWKGEDEEAEYVCDECGFEAASAGGLKTHERSHADEDELYEEVN